jgi:hypothetical protein
MQPSNVGINPRVLSDKELVRIAENLMYQGGLPENFQKELIDRLADHCKY